MDRFIINVLAQAIVSLQVLHNSYILSMLFCRFQVLSFFMRVTSGSPGLSQWVSGSPDCDSVATLVDSIYLQRGTYYLLQNDGCMGSLVQYVLIMD